MPRPIACLSIVVLATCLALAGCATTAPVASLPTALFDDARFAPPAQPLIGRADLFALSDDMRRFVRDDMPVLVRRHGRQRGLLQALEKRAGLKIEYDAQMTRTAAQAFEVRAGNCMSLVLMTAAFAKEMGLPVTYRTAVNGELWSRSNDLYLRSGHVNLTIGRHALDGWSRDDIVGITVDFIPPEQAVRIRTRAIDEDTVVAMFMSNRAAESLVDGRVDEAYWYAREALRQNPAYLDAYNTLGVVYLRHGDLALAEKALTRVLREAPTHTQAMANLIGVHERAGRTVEAARLREALTRLEPNPPFHFFNLGREAMARGDYAAARDLFAREVARDPRYHEFHFWLARACVRLGDSEAARRHLALAAAYSPNGNERALYSAKLAWLQTLH